MHPDLGPHETTLTGQWVKSGSSVIGDETTSRIKWLITERLERLGADQSGWQTLYRDRRDSRLWELSYPHSEWHGGGPPKLAVLANEEATRKYDGISE
jgi:hypothetical protein